MMLKLHRSVSEQNVRTRVAGSLGAMTTICSFLRNVEITEMQRLSKWWYTTGVSRIQNRVQLHTMTRHTRLFFLIFDTQNFKGVFEFLPRHKKIMIKHNVCDQTVFPFGFRYVQTVKNQIFYCGGIGISKKCFEPKQREDGSFYRTNQSWMGVERQQHSMCTSGDDSFVVTGSNYKLFGKKCQEYRISENLWYKLPDMSVSRFDHSSCSFRKRVIYVFGGYVRSL